MSNRTPRPGDLYKHFKGRLYQIITIAYHADTRECQVVYQALYGDFKCYVRSYDNFISKVDKVKYPKVEQEFRFESISQEEKLELQDPESVQSEMDITLKTDITMKTNINKETDLNHDNVFVDIKPFENNNSSISIENDNKNLGVDIGVNTAQKDETEQVNPQLLAFLDAGGNAEKIEVLYQIRKQIDENMMSAIEASLDIGHTEGTIEERIMLVRNNLATKARFEGTRLR